MRRGHLAVFFGGPDDGRWFWTTGSGRSANTLLTPERSPFRFHVTEVEALRPLRAHEYRATPFRASVEGGGYAVAYVYRRTA